jgi:hypothetical protein
MASSYLRHRKESTSMPNAPSDRARGKLGRQGLLAV